MRTSQFEAVKIAMNQNRTGYVLTLSLHPDEVPEEILRDFVGARYQVVMVRLNGENKPLNREQEYPNNPVTMAGILCRDPLFHKFLIEKGQTFDESEEVAAEWLRTELGISSRSELKENRDALRYFTTIQQEFLAWKQSV